MIKVGEFHFKDLQQEDYWIKFPYFGDLIQHSVSYFESYKEVDLYLDKDKVYQVSLDQSTSCTGIFIKDYKNTCTYMIEYARAKDMDADEYIFTFEKLIHRILEGTKVSHLIYEKPISNENYRSNQVLFQLEGIIRSLVKRYDEFYTAMLDCIPNASWRKEFILEDYKNLPNRKEASKYSANDIFDWTKLYTYSLGKDNDIYEAIGVMFGWFCSSFDSLGRPYVRGERFYGSIGGFVLPFASAKDVSEQFNAAGLDSSWFVQNPRKSIFENLASAVEKYKVICLELNEPFAMFALSVECNIKWVNPEKMTVVLVAPNFVDKRLFDITGDVYHFVI